MIKNENEIWGLQKVYLIDRKNGKWQAVKCDVIDESTNSLTLTGLYGDAVFYCLKNSSDLFETEEEATECAQRWNEVKKIKQAKDKVTKGKIAECELIGGCTAYGKPEFTKKLKKQIDEYQNKGYYVEVQYSLTGGEYSTLVIAREQ